MQTATYGTPNTIGGTSRVSIDDIVTALKKLTENLTLEQQEDIQLILDTTIQ